MTRQELISNSDIQLGPLQYERVVTAIPTIWKKLLKDNRTLNNDYIVFADCNIIINKMT